ncbi:MAG: hypothetical protein U0R51_01535 [Solirubrobacterales bacterium]
MKLRNFAAAAVALASLAAAALVPSQALAGPGDTVALVKDVDNAGSSGPRNFVGLGGNAYFIAKVGGAYQLFKTDGSDGNADPVGPSFTNEPKDLTRIGDQLFLKAFDGTHGWELWVSDGTNAHIVIDIRTSPDASASSNPTDITDVGGKAFFNATDDDGDIELWKSDGTAEGTSRVANINNEGPSSPSEITDVGGVAYFQAIDATRGWELWKSNGTEAGTTIVTDLNTASPAASSNPTDITDVGGTVFWVAATPATGYELRSYDGTTVRTMDIEPGPGDSVPVAVTALGNKAVFAADDGTNGYEPFVSDGQTFTPLGNLNTGSEKSIDQLDPQFEALGNRVYFAAKTPSTGNELWSTNGTAAGTSIVKDINTAGDSNPVQLRDVGGYLYMAADGGAGTGVEPWVSDGTAAGTKKIGEINPAGQNSYPAEFTAAKNGRVVFSAFDGSTGVELWRASDTVAPTTAITSGPAEGASIQADEATFGLGGDEQPLTFQCKLDGGSFAPCASPKTLTGIGLGAHTFQVRATDAAGNPGTTVTRNFTVVDTTAPELTVDGDAKQKSTKQVVVEATCNEVCDLAATGSISIPKIKRGKAKGKKTYPLGGTGRDGAAANSPTALTLTIKGKRAQKALKKAIKAKKASTATVTVTAADQSGNDAGAETFKVKVGK